MARFFACHRPVSCPMTWEVLFSAALGVVASQSLIYAGDVLPLDGPSFAAHLASVDKQQFLFLPLEENQQPRALTADQFVRWYKNRKKNRPFFAWINFFDAHGPYSPPHPWKNYFYSGDPYDETNQKLPLSSQSCGWKNPK